MQMNENKCKLSVNVNKIATLRNARGGDVPNVLQVSRDLLKFGAEGITVHPRPDGRHIRTQDVIELAELMSPHTEEFNVEGYPSQEYIELVKQVRPDQCTLVPDPPDVITSNAGWDFKTQFETLQELVPKVKECGARISLFIDVHTWEDSFIDKLKDLNVERVELYTESYAKAFGTSEQDEIVKVYAKVAQQIHSAGIGLNAGHDLDSKNLNTLVKAIPQLLEVSIGHAFIADALYWGLEKTTQTYLQALKI